jgi:hypothetical protein
VVAHKPSFKTHSETLSVSDHPVRSIEVASQHFLDVAASPPHEEGNNLAQKFVKKTRNPALVVQGVWRKICPFN